MIFDNRSVGGILEGLGNAGLTELQKEFLDQLLTLECNFLLIEV